MHLKKVLILIFFFFNDTATTEIYTLSLHDALPILERETDSWRLLEPLKVSDNLYEQIELISNLCRLENLAFDTDRKSTRLNSSH